MDTELVEKYVSGELEGEELSAFESRLLRDPELAADVKKEQLLHVALRDENRRQTLDRLKRIAAAIEEEKGQTRPFRIPGWTLMAAIILILLLPALFLLWPAKKDNQELFAHYFESYPDKISSKGPTKSALEDAMQAYNSRDYDKALQLFSQLPDSLRADSKIYIYEANSQLAIKQPTPAIQSLQQAIALNDPLYRDAANWYLALAFLLQNEPDQAIPVLKSLKSQNAPKYGELAVELLRELGEK